MTDFLEALPRRAAALSRSIVYPETGDPRVLDAVARIVREGIADPVLLGSPGVVKGELADRGLAGSEMPRIFDPEDPERVAGFREQLKTRPGWHAWGAASLDARARDPLMQAALMVGGGEVHGAVAGCVRSTSDVLRAALRCVGLSEGIETLSSAFYMDVARPDTGVHEVLTFTDAGVVPDPSVEQLAEIALAAVRARTRVVGDEPRVAFLSYSSHGSARGPGVDKMREACERFRALDPETPADGELQADAALEDAVRARKAPGSPLARSANILVFPNLDAGNIAYKLVQRLAGATALGPVLQGLAGAVNDLSRGSDSRDILLVSCITALLAEAD